MAVAVAGHRERVDGEHLVTGSGQRFDPQAAVGFDADHHLVRFVGVGGHQFVEPTDPGKSLREPTRCQRDPVGVHQMYVVVVLGPIVSNEDRQLASLLDIG